MKMNYWSPRTFLHPSLQYGSLITIDNRIFLLGLDELFRCALKDHEQNVLLPHARTVADLLHISPLPLPIEGYYTETPALREYFQIMRTFQELPLDSGSTIHTHHSYQALLTFVSAPIFGPSHTTSRLLPRSKDALTEALRVATPPWTLPQVIDAAYEQATSTDDISLVGLAARARDAVALTALRETVVLYEEVYTLGSKKELEVTYVWMVDEELTTAAQRFITTFNSFVPNALPNAHPEYAALYFTAFHDNDFVGRCVRIATTPNGDKQYHWAIYTSLDNTPKVVLDIDTFWDGQLWTTDQYRKAQKVHPLRPYPFRPFQVYGIPKE